MADMERNSDLQQANYALIREFLERLVNILPCKMHWNFRPNLDRSWEIINTRRVVL